MLVRILKIIEAIDKNKPLDEDIGAWLKQGLIRCVTKGELLHSALNLSHIRYSYLLRKRNECLFKAWLLTNPNLSDWKRSKELHEKINEFVEGRWSNVMCDKFPPENMTPINKEIFYALKPFVDMPKTLRGLHLIVNSMR